jgi:uncharacterized protein (DUF362 family)
MGSLVNRRVAPAGKRSAWYDRIVQVARGHGDGWGSDKQAVHQGFPMMNINLALLAARLRPHLSVLDGFVGMEGSGPVNGTPVPWGIAVAGTDPLAVDVLAAQLMGFDLKDVGYLNYCAQLGLGCADLAAIQVVGNTSAQAVTHRFTPHPRHHEQRCWHHRDAVMLLRQAL